MTVLPYLDDASSMGDVMDNLDRVIDWSLRTGSAIGYFASAYKRSTYGVNQAIGMGHFDDGQRMDQLGTLFANRYFAALNAYFYPGSDDLAPPWQLTFDANTNERLTMLQHMVLPMNAHICLDLGTTVAEFWGDSLASLDHDFHRVNNFVNPQIGSLLVAVERCSPNVGWLRRVIPYEVGLIQSLLIGFRQEAWRFAVHLSRHPDPASRKASQATRIATRALIYRQPPPFTLVPAVTRGLLSRESTDVRANIEALEAAPVAEDAEPRWQQATVRLLGMWAAYVPIWLSAVERPMWVGQKIPRYGGPQYR